MRGANVFQPKTPCAGKDLACEKGPPGAPWAGSEPFVRSYRTPRFSVTLPNAMLSWMCSTEPLNTSFSRSGVLYSVTVCGTPFSLFRLIPWNASSVASESPRKY